jgi:DNA polymerase III gamma/tau subunit
MADLSPNIAWYQKYRPKTINDLVFENDNHKTLVENWLIQGSIDGNVLLYGPHGKGKTTLSRILITEIIKNQNDLYRMMSRSVKEIDEIAVWIKKKPVGSKKKIVYIEEFDKLSGQALGTMKDTLMEDYQSHASFICTTNHYNSIPGAVLDRFNHQLAFDGKNIEGVKRRLTSILEAEGAKFDTDEFDKFITTNSGRSFRKIISYLQESFVSNNGIINFAQLEKALNIEQNVTNLFVGMINQVMRMTNPKDKKQSMTYPLESPIAKEYQQFVTILHNNYDLNYGSIFEKIYDNIKFIPIKLILSHYFETSDHKKWAHAHMIGCWYECMKCATEITM